MVLFVGRTLQELKYYYKQKTTETKHMFEITQFACYKTLIEFKKKISFLL